MDGHKQLSTTKPISLMLHCSIYFLFTLWLSSGKPTEYSDAIHTNFFLFGILSSLAISGTSFYFGWFKNLWMVLDSHTVCILLSFWTSRNETQGHKRSKVSYYLVALNANQKCWCFMQEFILPFPFRIPLKTYCLLAFLTLGTMGFSNSSLQYLNYPTQVLFFLRLCCP